VLHQVVAGIGDSPDDCVAYSQTDIEVICRPVYWSHDEVLALAPEAGTAVKFYSSWGEIASALMRPHDRK
jgi:hypothetical protein